MTVLEPISSADGTPAQYVMFTCPGCGQSHCLGVGSKATGPKWTWNGSTEKPTLTPSILAQSPSMSLQARERNREFFAFYGRFMTREELPYDLLNVCHSFVTDGMIMFLSDCTHPHKNQTLPLPKWSDDADLDHR